jgi:sulfate adenylyltransferase subunit 1
MDLVEYKEEVFDDIVNQYEEMSGKMMIKDVRYIPLSALNGDNVVVSKCPFIAYLRNTAYSQR